MGCAHDTHPAKMKHQEHKESRDGLASERQENERPYAYNRAYPKALHCEIVDIGPALDGRPEQALEAALAARGRIREA